jgi:hypothetical protein
MEFITSAQDEGYQAPVVLDAGEVAEVTLGSNGFDRQDGSQYRDKTPGVSAL